MTFVRQTKGPSSLKGANSELLVGMKLDRFVALEVRLKRLED